MKPGPCENAAERAKALVRSLGSDDWKEREGAEEELADLMLWCPDEVEPIVAEAAVVKDPEVRIRIRRLRQNVPWTRFQMFLNSLVARKKGKGQLQVITTREILSNPCRYWEEMRKVENPRLEDRDDLPPGFLAREDWIAALDELDDICNREFSAEVTRGKADRVAAFLSRLRMQMGD
ncbi:MAG: hypothetical protein HUU15_03070 [Candidatus Brocadiae bacterium]|nr:hypothetical protein [Candidatus Brocadiia bacterium]